jgi:hypothetical protein
MASTLTKEMREAVESDPFFETSCLSGKRGGWNNELKKYDPIVINHTFLFAGKQIQEVFNMTPLLDSEHDNEKDSFHRCQETREKVELICLMRASEEEIKKFNLGQKKKYLEKKYGK